MRIMWAVFSKEFLDIIRDRRRFLLMLCSTFIVFPLLMLGPYAYMFTRAAKQSADVLTIPVKGLDQAPDLVAYLAEEHDIQSVAADDVDALVESRQYPVGLIIPPDYERALDNGRSAELTVVADKRRTMDLVTNRLTSALREYSLDLMKTRLKQRGLQEEFLTPLIIEQENVATSTETTGSMLGFLIPGILVSLALSAGMPMAVSSIAGEKQKLTLEPVLFTTVSRFQLVLAKLMAVMVAVIGTIFSLAFSFLLMGAVLLVVIVRTLPVEKVASSAAAGTPAPASSASLLTGGYQLDPLAILLFLLAPLLIILLGGAFQIVISTWARNDEEATTYLAPLNLIAGLVVFITIFLDDYIPRLWHYGLPVFGTILSMRDLLSNKVELASLMVMFGTSTLYALLMITFAVWMFQREEVVFRT